jgi:hypothetical protein
MKNTLRLLLLALPLLACDRSAPVAEPSGLSRNQFIDIYVKLRRAQVRAQSAQEFQRLKQQVFREAGVSEESLQKYVKEHANDVEILADVWDTISNRLTQPADTARDQP